MQHTTQVALVNELLRHIDAGTTARAEGVARNRGDVLHGSGPARARVVDDPAGPQFFGLSCRLPAPGSYVTDDATGVPVLLVRGEDGRVRSFLNVCGIAARA